MVKKILLAHTKRNKKRLMVMFISMNVLNTAAVEHMNKCAHQQLYTPVGCNRKFLPHLDVDSMAPRPLFVSVTGIYLCLILR